MIPEEMLRAAAARSNEIYVEFLVKGYDPQNQHEFSPEFEKSIQDIIAGKSPRSTPFRRLINSLRCLFVPKRQ